MEQPENHAEMQDGASPVEWLAPGAALARFEPPAGVQLAAAGPVRKETRARYGFRVGELGLLIDPDTGSEVLSVPAVTPLPDAPPGFFGLINLRGNLVPLYELRVLLGIGQSPAQADSKVLVFGQGEQAVGVVIDGYPSALSALHPLPHLPPLPDVLQPHVPAGHMQDGTVWLEFDHGSFFDEACRNYA